MFFVKRLGDIQTFLRTETEQAIRVPLQFRQVVQKRRGRALRCGIDGFDRRLARKCPLDDRLCLHAVNRQTRDPSGPYAPEYDAGAALVLNAYCPQRDLPR